MTGAGRIGFIRMGRAAPELRDEVGLYCAAPRHSADRRSAAFIVAISPCDDYPDGMMQATCEDCLAALRTDTPFPELV